MEQQRELGLDPSDADDAVIQRQRQTLEPIEADERMALPLVCRGSMQGLRGMERWLASRS